jgi:hypothetical protein
MKKILLIVTAFIIVNSLSGKNFKISVAPTINNAFYFQAVYGGSSHIAKPGFSTSIGYYILRDRKVSYSAGFSYQFAQVKTDPMFNGMNDPLPYSESFNLITFNVGMIYNLKKDFYLSVDPIMDLQLDYEAEQSIDDQTGIGISCGVGKSIGLFENLKFNIEPRLWIHNLIPLQDENLPLRISVAGLFMGLIF